MKLFAKLADASLTAFGEIVLVLSKENKDKLAQNIAMLRNYKGETITLNIELGITPRRRIS